MSNSLRRCIESERETLPQPLKHILAGRQSVRREMVPRPRGERMIAMCAAFAPEQAAHDRRAFVVRLVAMHAFAEITLALGPGTLEIGFVARRIMAREKFAFLADARRDEFFRNVAKHRLPLERIRLQKRLAAPALQPRGQFPAEIDCVFEAIVEAEAAIGQDGCALRRQR